SCCPLRKHAPRLGGTLHRKSSRSVISPPVPLTSRRAIVARAPLTWLESQASAGRRFHRSKLRGERWNCPYTRTCRAPWLLGESYSSPQRPHDHSSWASRHRSTANESAPCTPRQH